MTSLSGMTEIYLHREFVDFRKSINGLMVIVEDEMNLSPFNHALFVFCNRGRDKVKALLPIRPPLVVKSPEAVIADEPATNVAPVGIVRSVQVTALLFVASAVIQIYLLQINEVTIACAEASVINTP